MNQPTREEFEAFKAEIREEVKQLREQRTEEIKVTRVEVASADVLNQLKGLQRGQQEISQKQDDQFKQLKDDFESLSGRQNEYEKGLISHSRNISTLQNQMNDVSTRIGMIESTMATKQDLTVLATKESLATLKAAQDAHFDQIEAEQKQQHGMLRQILQLLGQKE